MGMDLNAAKDSAMALYDAGQYAQALELYEQMEVSGVRQSELFYNMGNCYTRMGELGEARVLYERALIWNPNNADAQHNLDWIKLHLTDALVEPRQELMDWLGVVFRSVLDPQSWALISWSLLIAAMVLLIIRKWRRPELSWRWPLTLTSIGLTVMLVGWISAPKSTLVVVTAPSAYGYSEPNAQSKRIVLLSEGSAARLQSQNDSWFFVALGDGRMAWFAADQWGRVLREDEID
jgi:tetratricopeptide (TPR) repeat protein